MLRWTVQSEQISQSRLLIANLLAHPISWVSKLSNAPSLLERFSLAASFSPSQLQPTLEFIDSSQVISRRVSSSTTEKPFPERNSVITSFGLWVESIQSTSLQVRLFLWPPCCTEKLLLIYTNQPIIINQKGSCQRCCWTSSPVSLLFSSWS